MKNKLLIYSFFTLIGLTALAMPHKAYAICQVVCPIVVAGTLTLMERFGIDNSITGLWIGGALVLCSIMTIDWLRKWKYHWSINIGVFVLFYVGTFLPLYFQHIVGNPLKEIWGMDKTLVGVVIGSIFFYLGDWWYRVIKEKNGGHAWFPFQKALMPIIPLAILSLIFYYVTINDIH